MSLDTVEGLAAALQSQVSGMTHEAALIAARRHFGVAAPVQSPAEIARDERILEDEEQREITRLFLAYGFKVRSTSQKRPAKVSPDFPDLWVTRAARPTSPAFAGWFESKRQVGGERTSGQVDFGNECIAAGVAYSFGDRYDAAKFLVTIGAAVEDAHGQYGIRPAVVG